MLRYEVLFLTVPEITKDETDNLEKAFAKLVKENSGQLVSYERWGKYKLAYPVRNNEYGVYFLTRFETTPEHDKKLLEDLQNFFKIKHQDIVMRFLVCELDPKKPLTYQRPPSLEEVSSRPRETMHFFKETRTFGSDTGPRDQEMHKRSSRESEHESSQPSFTERFE